MLSFFMGLITYDNLLKVYAFPTDWICCLILCEISIGNWLYIWIFCFSNSHFGVGHDDSGLTETWETEGGGGNPGSRALAVSAAAQLLSGPASPQQAGSPVLCLSLPRGQPAIACSSSNRAFIHVF